LLSEIIIANIKIASIHYFKFCPRYSIRVAKNLNKSKKNVTIIEKASIAILFKVVFVIDKFCLIVYTIYPFTKTAKIDTINIKIFDS
jgi:glutathionyl-hydroquinone reductase